MVKQLWVFSPSVMEIGYPSPIYPTFLLFLLKPHPCNVWVFISLHFLSKIPRIPKKSGNVVPDLTTSSPMLSQGNMLANCCLLISLLEGRGYLEETVLLSWPHLSSFIPLCTPSATGFYIHWHYRGLHRQDSFCLLCCFPHSHSHSTPPAL